MNSRALIFERSSSIVCLDGALLRALTERKEIHYQSATKTEACDGSRKAEAWVHRTTSEN